MVGWVCILFTIAGFFWLNGMVLGQQMVAMLRSGQYMFLWIMWQMLLRETRASLLMVMLT